MKEHEADYLYKVWLRGGNPDRVNLDEIPEDFDFVWDEPDVRHIRNDHDR